MRIGAELKRLVESHGGGNVAQVVSDALSEKKINPYHVHFKDLVETFLGRDYLGVQTKLQAAIRGDTRLLEATSAMDVTAFSSITGQILVTVIKEKYQSPEFVAKNFFRTIPNPGGNLKEHKVPYLSDVDTAVDSTIKPLAAQEPYPQSKFQESWITLAAPEKRGRICKVSMEAIYSDLTGQVQDSAASVGYWMAYEDEVRRLRVLLGLVNNAKWNDNALTTYLSTAGTGNYANKILSNPISNYTHVNNVEQLANRMVDPITGRLIQLNYTQCLAMPEKKYELKRVFGATEVRDATSGTHNVTPSPLDTNYQMFTSKIARALLVNAAEGNLSASDTKERVYFTDGDKAFYTREVYPMFAEHAPSLNPWEFEQDIVLAVRCGLFNVHGCYDPRFAALSVTEAA